MSGKKIVLRSSALLGVIITHYYSPSPSSARISLYLYFFILMLRAPGTCSSRFRVAPRLFESREKQALVKIFISEPRTVVVALFVFCFWFFVFFYFLLQEAGDKTQRRARLFIITASPHASPRPRRWRDASNEVR